MVSTSFSKRLSYPRILVLAIFAFISFRHSSLAQTSFTLTSPHMQNNRLTMRVNDEEEVAITITDPALGTDIRQVKYPESNDVLRITETATGVKLKALKSAPLLNLTFTLQDRQDIQVTIIPRVDKSKIRVASSADMNAFTANNETVVPIKQNKTSSLALEPIDGIDATELVKLVSVAEDVLTVSPNNRQWSMKGLRPVESAVVEVRDKVSDELVAKLNFKVQETAQNLQFTDLNVHLKEPKPGTAPTPKPLREVFSLRGAAGTDFTPAEAVQNGNITISASSNPAAFTIVNHEIIPHSAGAGTFTVTSDSKEFRTFYVTVDPVASTITFKPALPIVIIGQTLSVIATVLDKNGQPQFNRSIKWESLNSNELAVVADNNNVAQLVGLTVPASGGPVKVRATVVDDPSVTQEINVFVRGRDQVLGFELLEIRLDLVDEQMARDLFGKKTVDDLYVAKVRLYNNLRTGSGENVGDSILVFSESLEANVSLEKRCAAGNNSDECNQNRGRWLPLTQCDISVIRGLNQVVAFMTATGRTLPTPSPSPQCLLNTPFPVPTPEPVTTPAPALPNPAGTPAVTTTASFNAKKAPIRTVDPNFPGRYRPYTFEMVANTHDRRDERSLRSRSLLIANSLGSLTSFVTAIAVPGPSSDLPLGLDKFQNLLIPSFEKLFPSLREPQRINLITQTMKPLEEVPYGSDITRVIFFPKKPLKGVLPGYLVRFTGVSTYNLSAEAAIIKKNVRP